MSRTPDEHRRSELLEKVASYTIAHGIAGLSLRPLAKAVGSSPRALLYHFGSKERLIVEALTERRRRQMGQIGGIELPPDASPEDFCLTLWAMMSSDEGVATFRAFIEATSLSLHDPDLFPGFLRDSVEQWLTFGHAERVAQGYTPQEARAFATIIVGGFRGFMLDLCATGDRDRVNLAFKRWLGLLSHFPLPENPPHAD